MTSSGKVQRRLDTQMARPVHERRMRTVRRAKARLAGAAFVPDYEPALARRLTSMATLQRGMRKSMRNARRNNTPS